MKKIPIENIWVLMFYASDLRLQQEITRGMIEQHPKQLLREIARLFCQQVSKVLHRGELQIAFQTTGGRVSRVRGKIDHLRTERGQLLRKGEIYCHYDRLSYDIPRYRYVLAALRVLSRQSLNRETAVQVGQLQHHLQQLGVTEEAHIEGRYRLENFSSREEEDLRMVLMAQLIFHMGIPTTQVQSGCFYFNEADDRDQAWLRRLFEKAIAGFYRFWLNPNDWRVTVGNYLSWQIDSPISPQLAAILPKMKVDITLFDRHSEQLLIIDTRVC